MALSISMQTSSQRIAEVLINFCDESPIEALESARNAGKNAQIQLQNADIRVSSTGRRNIFTLSGETSLITELFKQIDPPSWFLS